MFCLFCKNNSDEEKGFILRPTPVRPPRWRQGQTSAANFGLEAEEVVEAETENIEKNKIACGRHSKTSKK
jgi:hypothetical protein